MKILLSLFIAHSAWSWVRNLFSTWNRNVRKLWTLNLLDVYKIGLKLGWNVATGKQIANIFERQKIMKTSAEWFFLEEPQLVFGVRFQFFKISDLKINLSLEVEDFNSAWGERLFFSGLWGTQKRLMMITIGVVAAWLIYFAIVCTRSPRLGLSDSAQRILKNFAF